MRRRRYGDIANTRQSNFIGVRSVGVGDQRGLIFKDDALSMHLPALHPGNAADVCQDPRYARSECFTLHYSLTS